MTPGYAILRPFLDDQASARRRRLWLALLLGAPLALALGLWLDARSARSSQLQVSLDRATAIARAREAARELGVDASAWSAVVKLERRPNAEAYYDERPLPPGSRLRRLMPSVVVGVLLRSPDGGAWSKVTMGPDGFVVGLSSGGRPGRPPGVKGRPSGPRPDSAGQAPGPPESRSGPHPGPPEPPPDAARLRAVAEKSLRAWLGDTMLDRLGEPEESGPGLSGRGPVRYTWRGQPRRLPEVELVFHFEVMGERISERSVEPVFAPAFLERRLAPLNNLSEIGGSVRALLLLLLAAYACYRFTRRTLEKEAPIGRALLLGGVLLAIVLVMVVADPYRFAGTTRPDMYGAGLLLIITVSTLLVSTVQALLLGIAYAAGEGDVREAWPGKLTALDTLLTGRVWASNVGASLLAGCALAAWAFLVLALLRLLVGPGFDHTPFPMLAFGFGQLPALALLLNLLLPGLLDPVICLLVPLMLLRRHVRVQGLVYALLVAVALLAGGVGEQGWSLEPGFWVERVMLTAATLVPFFLADYLAAMASLVAFSFLRAVPDLASSSPYWHSQGPGLAWLAALTLVPFALSAWLGRRYAEDEVAPRHARNLAERLSLQAELDAARQAQLRLLPAGMPAVPGLSLAASLTPAAEVGGDFYDFYPIGEGRLACIVAEGGNEGLASALTIAMAKGFLMYESSLGGSPADALRRLEAALGAHLQRSGGGRTSLALLTIDPLQRAVQFSRCGGYPRLAVLRRSGALEEPEPDGEPGQLQLEFSPGDQLLIYTDGLPRVLQAGRGGSVAELLRRAGESSGVRPATRLLETLLAELLGDGRQRPQLSDDLTAVVVRFEPPTPAPAPEPERAATSESGVLQGPLAEAQ